MGDSNIEILERGQVLHLKNARRSDKGRYQCTVSNAAGKQSKDIKLTIYSKCGFLLLLLSILIIHGKSGLTLLTALLCNAK